MEKLERLKTSEYSEGFKGLNEINRKKLANKPKIRKNRKDLSLLNTPRALMRLAEKSFMLCFLSMFKTGHRIF